MIRDPSDGSVRERRKFETGIPEDREAKDLAKRLEASREWLKDYLGRKGQHDHSITAATPEESAIQPGPRPHG